MSMGREVKKVVQTEVEQANRSASVTFKDNGDNQVRAEVAYGGKKRVFYFGTNPRKRSAIQNIRSEVRGVLRDLGALTRKDHSQKVGSLGLAMQAAMNGWNLPKPPDFAALKAAAAGRQASQTAQASVRPDPPAAHHSTQQGEAGMQTTKHDAPVPNGAHPPASRKKFQLDHAAVVRLSRLLDGAGELVPGDDGQQVFQWKIGESDQTVRDAFNKDWPVERIVEFRREHFARTAAELKPKSQGKDAIIEALRAKVDSLEARVTQLEAAFK